MLRILLTVAIAAAACLQVGAATTPDSLGYLNAAEVWPWYPIEYRNWGPLLPALLAFIPPLWVNALLLASLVGMVSWYFRAAGWWTWGIATMVVAFSPTTQYVFGFVWSEGPFMVFTLAFLLAWTAYLERRTAGLLVAASGFLTLALLSRHIGIVLFVVAALTLLQDGHRPIRTLVQVSLAPACLFGLWALRNTLIYSAPTPERFDGTWAEVVTTLHGTGSIVGSWAAPHLHLAGLMLALPALAYIVTRLRRGPEWVLAHFVVIYLTTMVVLTATLTIPPMHLRFMAPLFAPAVIVVVAGVSRCYAAKPHRAIEYTVLVWSLAWLTVPNGIMDMALARM